MQYNNLTFVKIYSTDFLTYNSKQVIACTLYVLFIIEFILNRVKCICIVLDRFKCVAETCRPNNIFTIFFFLRFI